MVSYAELPGYGEPNKAGCLELISRYGFYQLGGGAGCRCSHFAVCGFHVNVSCHKSEHCVRVYSHHLFRQPEDEVEIASLVIRQLGDSGENYRVRYCEYRHDHENGRRENGVWTQEYSCCYCNKPRLDEDGYLCAGCLKKLDAVSHYPFGLEHLRRKCPECGEARVEIDLLGLSEIEKKPILLGGHKVGFSMAGTLPKQEGKSIFICLKCGHHWWEPSDLKV